MLPSLYEQDFYLWLKDTAQLLKESDFEKLDLENLIEEIESMGRKERRELQNRLITIIEHLLKLIYWLDEKEDNGRGWRITVVEQRRQLIRLLKDSPSLKPWLKEIFFECYQVAREDTLQAHNLPEHIFPVVPSFTLEDILNPDYLPE